MSSRAAVHEAGHIVAAARLGLKPLSVTIAAGAELSGCARWLPPAVPEVDGFDVEDAYVTWPVPVRARVESDYLVSIAGFLAEDLFGGDEPAEVPVPVIEQVEQPGVVVASAADLAWASKVVDEPARPSDVTWAARTVFLVAGRDYGLASVWRAFMDAQARALLLDAEKAVRAVAASLDAHTTLGAEALSSIISGRGLVLVR